MARRTNKKIKRILAIETSCDETAITLIQTSSNERAFHVLSNIVLSQIALHTIWGGVVPNLAKREHEKNLMPLLLQTVQEVEQAKSKVKNQKSKVKSQNPLKAILAREPELLTQFEKHILNLPRPTIDLIAVTQGPGLEPALWVGVNFARALSFWWEKPLIGINHMEGHIVSALLAETNSKVKSQKYTPKAEKLKLKNQKTKGYQLKTVRYPAIALLVSGGHTELVLMKKPLHYEIIGETCDDAAGEAFDKVARLLGLPYPGGPSISAFAENQTQCTSASHLRVSARELTLPRPMLHTKNFDFSFSGLKTAVLYLVRDLEKQGVNIKKLRPAIAKEFQNAVVDVLVTKTIRAAKYYHVTTILLGGGVAANTELRKRLTEEIKKQMPTVKCLLPSANITGDNALMIATAAYVKLLHNKKLLTKKDLWKTMQPDANMRISSQDWKI